MSARRRTLLRVLLFIMAADALLGSLVAIAGGRGLLSRLLPMAARPQVNDLFVLHKLETAGLGLGLAVMLFLAGRNPEKTGAIIVGMAVALCAMAVLEVGAHVAGNTLYPTQLVWAHGLIRVTLAAALFWLRPRI